MILAFLRPFLNPTIILGFIAVFFATGFYHDLTNWVENRGLIKPWAVAVQERDRAGIVKDHTIAVIAQEKDRAEQEANNLRESLETAEAARMAAGVRECVWTADDSRVLNLKPTARH